MNKDLMSKATVPHIKEAHNFVCLTFGVHLIPCGIQVY